MSSPEKIDFDVLLAAFEGDHPAGKNLRDDDAHDSLFRRLRAVRDESSLIERKYLEEPDNYNLGDCDWSQVQRMCLEVLSQHSKDFEVSAWLAEALVRREGFAGLRDAFRLARELAERHWDHLYPLPEDGDITPRIRLMGGLFKGALMLPVKRIPITAHDDDFLVLESADRLERITDSAERQRYLDRGAKTRSELDQAIRQTPDDFYRDLMADLDQCIEQLRLFDTVLSEKCGKDESGYERGPSTSDTVRALTKCQQDLTSLLGDRLQLLAADDELEDEESEEGDAPNAISTVRQDTEKEMTRDVAFRLLSDLAVFFRRTEPHSPVSHHIEQAVRWGRMSLPDLLSELITDEKSRGEVFTRVGIDQPGEAEGS